MVGGYIQPAGTIQLYKGINISPNYSDVVLFESYAARDAYFSATAKSFTQESYTRETADSVKILCTSTEIDSCNYMRFQNNINGASRWYYAFITAVEYVNNNTTRVYYKIDEFTTWFLKDMLQQCFVEREIPDHDEIGDNIVPENLELGEYVSTYDDKGFELNDMVLLLCVSTDENGDYPEPGTDISNMNIWIRVNGVQSPLLYRLYDPKKTTDMAGLQALLYLYNHNGYMENIIFLQLVPRFCIENAFTGTSISGQTYGAKLFETDMPQMLDFYAPKNKKLFTYPYAFIRATDHMGTSVDYRYEFFREKHPMFMFYSCVYGEPTIICYPSSYKGYANDLDEALVCTNFPQCPTANDTYKAWLAQNANSVATGVLATVISTAVGVGAGLATMGAAGVPAFVATMGAFGAAGSAASGVGNILQTMGKVSDAKHSPTTIAGLTRANMINLIRGTYEIAFTRLSVTGQMAKKIDDFFTAYGYAVHEVKKPCLTGRPFFNYVKTQGCILAGDIPATAKAAIIQAFDNGIRLWKTNSRIGTFDGNGIG